MGRRYIGQPTYDLVGQRYGKLTVLSWLYDEKVYWVCECDCGNRVHILTGNLRRGDRSSCGCGHDRNPNSHKMSNTRTYRIWVGIKARCNNPNDTGYKWYGAKGIKVCDAWNKSFENFLSDMGEAPKGMQIDRILNDEGYYKENCRWVTNKENSNNRGETTTDTFKNLTTNQLETLLAFIKSIKE